MLTESVRLERDGALLECFLVPWDSEVFGRRVAQVERFEFTDDAQADGLLDALDDWCTNQDIQLVSCRLEHSKLRASMALEGHGFRFIELVYRPRLDSIRDDVPQHPGISVAEVGPQDRETIERIASSAFSTGRFLLDWRLPADVSERRYARWVRTSMELSAHTVIKAVLEGQTFGFFIVERRPDQSVYWHLTAIDPLWQGKGLGFALWQTMLARHKAEAAKYVETTISGHNLKALNLYARLGFSFSSASMTFHRVVDAPI